MSMLTRRTVGVIGALVATGVLAVAAPTSASEVQREGDCVGPAEWRLEVNGEGGGLQLDLRIRGPKNRPWLLRTRVDGVSFPNYAGKSSTRDDVGFRIWHQLTNTRGTDAYSFRALGPGGEVCEGTVVS
jgi:hypothetical protein